MPKMYAFEAPFVKTGNKNIIAAEDATTTKNSDFRPLCVWRCLPRNILRESGGKLMGS
jgi:hypothetical protein